jgi:hypothetical protein
MSAASLASRPVIPLCDPNCRRPKPKFFTAPEGCTALEKDSKDFLVYAEAFKHGSVRRMDLDAFEGTYHMFVHARRLMFFGNAW